MGCRLGKKGNVVAKWFKLANNIYVRRAGECPGGEIVLVRIGGTVYRPDHPRAKQFIRQCTTHVNPDDFGNGGAGGSCLNW